MLLHEWTGWGAQLQEPSASERVAYTLFTSILGFLLVFRAQLSYARYWEGITLVERACGVWLNGCSNLIAFCSADEAKHEAVEEFQYLLSRLISSVVCFSLRDISGQESSRFQHLDVDALDPASVKYLESTSAKQYVALQWIQRLVVEGARNGVLDVAPPILSRVFQELSIGIVHFIDAQKLSVVPFPFGFAQMVWLMLVFFSIVPLPALCAIALDRNKALIYTFTIVFIFWAIYHMAVEIEMPFGNDENDLPLDKLNVRFNKVLQTLLHAKAQQLPRMGSAPRVSVRFERVESTLGLVATKGGVLAAVGRVLAQRPPAPQRQAGSFSPPAEAEDGGCGWGAPSSEGPPSSEGSVAWSAAVSEASRALEEQTAPFSSIGADREVLPWQGPPGGQAAVLEPGSARCDEAALERELGWRGFDWSAGDDGSASLFGARGASEVPRRPPSGRRDGAQPARP